MTTRWEPNSPALLPTIVCYADILGFGAETLKAHKLGEGSEFLQRITRSLAAAYDIVREAATPLGSGPPVFEMKVFTDNIVVAYPLYEPLSNLGEPELGTMLLLFAEVQSSLATEGFLLRGAIAEGQHYQDENIVYGEALLEAVKFDKSGGNPRLVIAPSLESWISAQLLAYGGGWAPHHDDLYEDASDERLFVNYLGAAFQDFPEGRIDYQLLERHREMVCRGLEEHETNQRVRSKYTWVAAYHNFVCRTFAEMNSGRGDEETDLETMALVAEAQRVLDYLVSIEEDTDAQSFHLLDEESLRQRQTLT